MRSVVAFGCLVGAICLLPPRASSVRPELRAIVHELDSEEELHRNYYPRPTPRPAYTQTPEPTAEPTPEPTTEPTPGPTSEPTPEPTPEPTAELTPAPTVEPSQATTLEAISEP